MNSSKIQKSFISFLPLVTVCFFLLVSTILSSCVMPTSDTGKDTNTTTQSTTSSGSTSGDQQGSDDSAHTHTYSIQWSKNETYHWHNATCEHTEQKLDYGLHSFGSAVTIKEPTLAQEGQKKSTCSICGYEKTEAIQKLELATGCEWWIIMKAYDPLDAYVYFDDDTPIRCGTIDGEITISLLLQLTKTYIINSGYPSRCYKVTDLSTLPSWCLN